MTTMDELLALPRVDSRDVAEAFGVQHDIVLRGIDAIRHTPGVARGWFREERAGPNRSFDLGRSGLMLLAMNWPGGLSVDARVAVIDAFDALRRRFLAECGPAALRDVLAPLNATVADLHPQLF
jgi:phage regulator Rha-like protein